jgi:hypothetical protein
MTALQKPLLNQLNPFLNLTLTSLTHFQLRLDLKTEFCIPFLIFSTHLLSSPCVSYTFTVSAHLIS